MASNGQPLIRMEGVGKVFVTDEVETHALADVHLEIARGEYVSIAGPSGCGKSTLLAIMGLLDTPSSGRYVLGDTPVEKLTVTQRARMRNVAIGFVFQNFNLIGDLTVYENVELPLVYRDMDVGVRKRKVREALEKVGMEHRINHYPAQLSGGQQQRVAVARAVAGDPAILLADEPTGNLDKGTGLQIIELLKELNLTEHVSVITATHDHKMLAISDRIAWVRDGRIERIQDRAELDIKEGEMHVR